MSYDTLPTLCVAVVALFAIQGASIYAIVHLVVTGRPMMERRDRDHDRGGRQIPFAGTSDR